MCLKPIQPIPYATPPKRPLTSLLGDLFSCASPAIQENLLLYSQSVYMLNTAGSVRFMYNNCINSMTSKHLNNFYKTFENYNFADHWRNVMSSMILDCIPPQLKDWPIHLIVDDTLVEKVGEYFERRDMLFDHCNKNGTSYIYGHCFVSLVVAIPVFIKNKAQYIRVPLEHRLWIPKKQRIVEQDEQNKLEMADLMIADAIKLLGMDKHFVIDCDAWYSKAPLTNWVAREDVHVEMVCAVRVNSRIYSLPDNSDGRKKQKIFGPRINTSLIELQNLPGTQYKAAHILGKAQIFGDREVSIYVTQPKNGGARKLFICTDPNLHKSFDCSALVSVHPLYMNFLKNHPEFVGYASYEIRWFIEIVYEEQKAWWGLSSYQLRIENGFMTQVNLYSVLYAITSLLPHLDDSYSHLIGLSIQERRAAIGRSFSHRQILLKFVMECEFQGCYSGITAAYDDYCNRNLLAV